MNIIRRFIFSCVWFDLNYTFPLLAYAPKHPYSLDLSHGLLYAVLIMLCSLQLRFFKFFCLVLFSFFFFFVQFSFVHYLNCFVVYSSTLYIDWINLVVYCMIVVCVTSKFIFPFEININYFFSLGNCHRSCRTNCAYRGINEVFRIKM